MESHLTTAPDSDLFLAMHEVKSLYDTLIIKHLMHTSQPELEFEAWYAQLDSSNRRIIQASQLKEYLIRISYTEWGEITKLIPGLEMGKVAESPKLSNVINNFYRRSPSDKEK
jgi:hypothetical protein